MRDRWCRVNKLAWVGIAGAVAVAIVISYVGYKTVRSSEEATAAKTACASVTALNQHRDDAIPVSTGTPVVVVLGDSYAQGQFLDDPRDDSWPALVGHAERWETHVNAIGGTGLTSGGPCKNQSFVTRAADVLDLNPQIVIVQSGLNDNPEKIGPALRNLASDLRAIPRIIVIGPVHAPGYDQATIRDVDRALAHTAATMHLDYISMLDFTPQIGPDGRHMTAGGHAAYADRVEEALR